MTIDWTYKKFPTIFHRCHYVFYVFIINLHICFPFPNIYTQYLFSIFKSYVFFSVLNLLIYFIITLPWPFSGDQGSKGPKGDIGPQGKPGIKGCKGLPGVNGTDGANGDQGPQGPQGEKGAKGDKGDKGDQGPVGEKGNAGDAGPNGTGGTNGIDGKYATFWYQIIKM